MSTLSSCVSTFSDLNARIQVTLLITNLSNQPIPQSINKQIIDFIRADELLPALNEFFVSRNETALQVTFARTIVEELLDLWLPTCRTLFRELSSLQDQKKSIQNIRASLLDYNTDISDLITDVKTGAPIPIAKYIDENLMLLNSWCQMLEDLNRRLIHLVRQFAPDLYKKNLNAFSQYISVKDYNVIDVDQDPTPVEQEKKTNEPLPKLQWKGDKTDLAELVWALSKSGRITDTSTMKDVTQKELAEQVASLFGLDSLDVVNLMKGRYGTKGKSTTYKAQDGKTFVNTLQTLLTDRILD